MRSQQSAGSRTHACSRRRQHSTDPPGGGVGGKVAEGLAALGSHRRSSDVPGTSLAEPLGASGGGCGGRSAAEPRGRLSNFRNGSFGSSGLRSFLFGGRGTGRAMNSAFTAREDAASAEAAAVGWRWLQVAGHAGHGGVWGRSGFIQLKEM